MGELEVPVVVSEVLRVEIGSPSTCLQGDLLVLELS